MGLVLVLTLLIVLVLGVGLILKICVILLVLILVLDFIPWSNTFEGLVKWLLLLLFSDREVAQLVDIAFLFMIYLPIGVIVSRFEHSRREGRVIHFVGRLGSAAIVGLDSTDASYWNSIDDSATGIDPATGIDSTAIVSCNSAATELGWVV